MKAVGLSHEELPTEPLRQWAASQAVSVKPSPMGIPLPRPPVVARPKRLSVTRIEKLIRDPYAIYAQAVLALEPLMDVSAKPNAALRGTLYHAAIGDFFKRFPGQLPDKALENLLALGRAQFEPFDDTPEIAGFWWARFKRIARWVVENEADLRGDAKSIFAEVEGAIELEIGAHSFRLTARADRIDIAADGTAHIIDFKSGAVPSSKAVKAGLSPQLTLEAAILERGGFKDIGEHQTRAVTYVRISGGVPEGEIKSLDVDAMGLAHVHLSSLTALLLQYQNEKQSYIPRYGMQREEDASEFDHLSRYWEWILAGEAS